MYRTYHMLRVQGCTGAANVQDVPYAVGAGMRRSREPTASVWLFFSFDRDQFASPVLLQRTHHIVHRRGAVRWVLVNHLQA